MTNVVMLLSNAFRPDPRVLKEAESLSDSGYDLTILCWDRKAELTSDEYLPCGVKIIRIQNVRSSYGIGIRQLSRLPFFWLSVQRYLRIIRPNIIHCHDFDTLPAGLLFGFFHHLPVIYDAHEYYVELIKPRLKGIPGWILENIIGYLEVVGSHLAKAIVTVDKTLATRYQKRNRNVIVLGHYPPQKMAFVRNPVFTRPEIKMIYTGRLSTDRGILVYEALLKKLLDLGIPARLILAGTFTPESERTIFFEHAKEVVGSIDFLGWIPYDKISEIYLRADIGLAILMPLPRYIAATPVKLFEYMASGLPVIASDFPSISEIVGDAHCGCLVDPLADIAPIADIIRNWYQDKTIPRIMGENGRQAILSTYNWDHQIQHLIDLYRRFV